MTFQGLDFGLGKEKEEVAARPELPLGCELAVACGLQVNIQKTEDDLRFQLIYPLGAREPLDQPTRVSQRESHN